MLYPLVNHEELVWFFRDHLKDDFARVNVRRHEAYDHGHGRDEMRFYFVCAVPDDLPDRERWPKLRAIGLAVNNTVRDGKEGIAFRYYILADSCRAGDSPRRCEAIEPSRIDCTGNST